MRGGALSEVGCDIVTEMFETGELAELLGVEQAEETSETPQVASGVIGIENRL